MYKNDKQIKVGLNILKILVYIGKNNIHAMVKRL